jgi:hypothetical protein
MRPVDDPLRWWLIEPRQLAVTSRTDQLWLQWSTWRQRCYAAEAASCWRSTPSAQRSGRYRLEAARQRHLHT